MDDIIFQGTLWEAWNSNLVNSNWFSIMLNQERKDDYVYTIKYAGSNHVFIF